MMALINHWDLKSDNNAIYEENGEHRYVVSDVGASFGRTDHHFKRTKDNLQHYADSDFIRETTPDTVDFHLKSRPMLFEAVLLPRYRQQAKREKIVKGIPREHARWMGQMLAGLSEQQIRDCFRAAGYKPEEADGYTVTLKQRIAQLNRL
ncbi:MAG TPA: hypothetical protein VGQ11_11160 [Candidatus Acidoferrales bacterium]|nr:hypothetical protein [Candidatus Acidoferrales bacterium]